MHCFNHILAMNACLMSSSSKEILENKLQETQCKRIQFCFIYFQDHLLNLRITLSFHDKLKGKFHAKFSNLR